MNEEELRATWEKFTKNNDFKLNPDKWHVDFIIKGVLENEKKYSLKLCPCRLRDETRQKDLVLICPCNFKIHETWLKPKQGMPQMSPDTGTGPRPRAGPVWPPDRRESSPRRVRTEEPHRTACTPFADV